MSRRVTLSILLLIALSGLGEYSIARPDDPDLDRQFEQVVRPFLNDHCLACHGPTRQEAKLDLSGATSIASVVKDHRIWETVLDRIEAEEMPPEKVKKQPSAADRKRVIDWIRAIRDREAKKNAGDPGPVLARRLSNAEYDNTIRDLIGVDIRPTREFPVDPANEAGFDNSGESLTMSPALAKKYLAAARSVADHIVLKSNGFDFSPHPVLSDSDRDKYSVRRILDFYENHRVDLAEYFRAAWQYQHRADIGKPEATVTDIATSARLSPAYLAQIVAILTEPRSESGPLGEIRAAFRKMPDDTRTLEILKRDCENLRALVKRLRKPLTSRGEPLHVNGISDGSQPFILARNRQSAANRMKPSKDGDSPEIAEFCRVFPDAFFVADRSSSPDVKLTEAVRPLTAGFHLMQGYFRDDRPLYDLVLNDPERKQLDALWDDLNFVTLAPMRQYKDFIFFERAEPPRFMRPAEFDFARSEDKSSTTEAGIAKLHAAYVNRAKQVGASEPAIRAMDLYFEEISSAIRKVETEKQTSEPTHLEALAKFAERSFRRPLSQAERDDILAFYRRLREKDELGHEDAIRDSVASILMSPHFLYRFEPADPGEASTPLSDHALASRLSYFLWASMPDDELMAYANTGDLHKPEVLTAQTRRMMRDPRIRGLATEFGGNWLDFRRFEEHNGVDRDRFASFTNDLREAMFEEPVRFFVDVASNDRSVYEFLEADHTFVNPILARHYGMPAPSGSASDWARINNAGRFGRGGLLPMSVFLTKNAPGLRTSPVKRGYWVVRRLLGEEIPPPPPDVPELPKEEAKSGDLTLPQLLQRHRDNPSCAGCHKRFDSVGLVFEGYGPIGERREKDLGGRTVETKATFPDGREGEGLDGLRRYLMEQRREEFVENLCRKLLAYGLGRTLMLSDDATIDLMRDRLAKEGNHFGAMVETIVTSPQFLRKRGRDDPRDR